MICSGCGSDNPEDMRFCGQCGTALTNHCPNCGFDNPPGFKFCGECGTPLSAEKSAPGASVRLKPAPAPIPTSFVSGRYEVKRFLGEGGKKKVYLAHDTTLDRDVAFALIKTEGLDDAGRARVRREAQAMGRLGDNPHIVPIHDLGEEGEQPYIVSQFMSEGDVEGLIEKAENHRIPLDQALRIAIETCRGLEFAHTHDIVHRDLKPGNVWLTADGVAKIGDFGLAVATDRSRLTQEDMMVGTVSYMPPEQAMGGTVEARSDLYSLGAMLYEMVSGRPPFVGDDSVAIIGQHLNTLPVAPSWHNPECPQALEALILRLLEKDPSKRPASAQEVHSALESIDLIAQPVGAIHESPLQTTVDNPIYNRTFVGRESEMRQLESAFDSALSGVGSLTMVVGEPGIGKTAICEQLATYVTLRGGKTLAGHCYEEGSLSLPYLAFVEAMRSYVLDRDPQGLETDLGTGAADVARIVSEIRDRVQVELRPAGDPEDDRWRLLQGVTTFLRNASTVQPLCIVLEDLHWSDRGTLDLLIHMARNLQGSRLLIVGTYRDVEVDRPHPLSSALAELRRGSAFQRVPLRGLTVEEVRRMVSVFADHEVRPAFAEGVHRQTEGNPLFIQEVLRYFVEEGLLRRQDGQWIGRWRETGEAPLEMAIPEGLRDVIGKRLTRLSDECNRVLSMAAVVGREFRLDVLQLVADTHEDVLFSAIEEAKGVGVVEERTSVGTGVTFRFTHAFFRQTLYEEMFTPRRIRFHQQVGRALEEVHSRRLEEHAAELTDHFSQSTEEEDLGKAMRYGEVAAQRAMGVYAYREAASHLERCLQVQEVLDPDDKAKRCDLLLALGEALGPAGEPQRVFEALAPEALGLAEELDDQERSSQTCHMALGAIFRYGSASMNDTPVFREWVERADGYAVPGTLHRVRADIALGRVKIGSRKFAEARLHIQRALELARQLDDAEGLFDATMLLIGPYTAPQQEEEDYHLAEEITRWPREGVSARIRGGILWMGGYTYFGHGHRKRAEELWHQLEELGERTHDGPILLRSMDSEGALATVDGRLEDALAIGERLLTKSEELGAPVIGRQYASLITCRPLIHRPRKWQEGRGRSHYLQ